MAEQKEDQFKGGEFDQWVTHPDDAVPADDRPESTRTAGQKERKSKGFKALAPKQKKLIVGCVVALGLVMVVMARKGSQQNVPVQPSPEIAAVTEKSAQMLQDGVKAAQASAAQSKEDPAIVAANAAAAITTASAPKAAPEESVVPASPGPASDVTAGASAAPAKAPAASPAIQPAKAVIQPEAQGVPGGNVGLASKSLQKSEGDETIVAELSKVQDELKRWRNQAARDARRAADAESKLAKRRYTVVSVLADGAVIRDSDGREHIVGVGGKVGAE